MLSEKQVNLIEAGMTEDVEPRKVAAYLCLHMGLMLAEVTALQLEDIDLNTGVLTLRNVASATGVITALDESRPLPMPPHVQRYLKRHNDLYNSSDCYILTGETTIPPFYHMQNVLTSICMKYKVGDTLSASDLRNAFIRRCIQCDMDLYSICAYIGIKQPNIIAKRFAEYFEPKLDSVGALDKYSADYESLQLVQIPEFKGPKRMNLLILGAGSQGPVVKEIAEAIGMFDEIAFLDDDTNNKLAIDTCEHYQRYLSKYPIAIPSFGDSYLRQKWIDRLEESGFVLPRLIDPSARVSTSAVVKEAVVIEAKSIISAGSVVSRGDIVSAGAVLDANSKLEEYVHIGAAATVSKNAVVSAYTRISSGTVVKAMERNQ